jgi:hypothetical protein
VWSIKPSLAVDPITMDEDCHYEALISRVTNEAARECINVTQSNVSRVKARARLSCRFLLSVIIGATVLLNSKSEAFVIYSQQQPSTCQQQLPVEDISEVDFMNDLISRAEEIQVERERDRLEESNRQAFLKRKPRKLPYEDARRWIQANLGPSTKEEFFDLVENGNLRTPYIPKRPEEYYTETREWVSWEHFLTGIFDKQSPSAIRPPSGIFD